MERILRDEDRDALIRLESAGADPGRVQILEFFLYFVEAEEAHGAGLRLGLEGFHAEVVRPDDTAWLVLVRKRMVPRLTELRALRHRFGALAAELGGTYDGWGVPDRVG